MTNYRDRILSLLGSVERPGMDAVIKYLKTSNYFKRGCYSHHKEYARDGSGGGLACHSLEVYDYMVEHASGLDAESILVAALFHDLGKTRRSDGRGHGARSIDILDECGLALTDAERIAIGRHHDKSVSFVTCPLRRVLSLGDCFSTGRWKRAHRRPRP